MALLALAACAALVVFAVLVFRRGYPLNVVVLAAMGRTVAQYVARGSTPVLPHWTLSLELAVNVVRNVADRFGDRVAHAPYYLKLRWLSELGGDFLGGFACRAHGTEVTPVRVNGLEHLWLKAKAGSAAPSTRKRKAKSPSARSASNSSTTASASASTGAASNGGHNSTNTAAAAAGGAIAGRRFVVLFFHGGGYVVNSPNLYVDYCNRLRAAILTELERKYELEQPQVDVLLVGYRKAPEAKFPMPPQDCVAAYKYLVNDEGLAPRQIILAGDSAGGGLVLSTMLRLRQSQPGLLPLAGLLLCPKASMAKKPSVSSSLSDEQPWPHCYLSPSLLEAFRLAYLKTPDDPSTWQDASPVHCDLRDLPPVFLQAATQDSLYSESLELANKVQADGITNWDVDVHEHMPHVFAIFPSFVLPYAQVAVTRMGKFAARQFASTLSSRAKYLKHRRASQVPAAKA